MSDWKPGDKCFMITNKSFGYVSQYTVKSQRPDGYYIVENSTGNYGTAAAVARMFRSKEEALASLKNPENLKKRCWKKIQKEEAEANE